MVLCVSLRASVVGCGFQVPSSSDLQLSMLHSARCKVHHYHCILSSGKTIAYPRRSGVRETRQESHAAIAGAAEMTWDVKIKKWHAVAAWTWDAGDDVCGICRMPFDGCPPDGRRPCLETQRATACSHQLRTCHAAVSSARTVGAAKYGCLHMEELYQLQSCISPFLTQGSIQGMTAL